MSQDEVVRALEVLAINLMRPESRIRNATIRGLGRFGGAGAADILSQAAEAHPNLETRRRAAGELKKSRARAR